MLSYPTRIALIAALGGFLFGFETAVISGAETTIEQLWKLSSFWQGFTVASSLIGTVLGSIVAGIPAQKFGRKATLMGISILYLVSAIGCTASTLWLLFVTFRFIGGIAVGASSVVGPMYISEISPAKQRGRLAGSFQLNIVMGIFVALITNFLFKDIGDNSWRWMLGVMVLPATMFAILLRTIPESPRWLVLNDRDDEAEKIFARTGEPNAAKLIREEHELSKHGVKEHLFNGKYRKPIIFAMLLAMFNQLSGINAIFYYAPRIFELAGSDKANAYLQPVYLGAANLVFTLLAMSVIDRFGRKKLLLIGSVGMIIFLALTGASINTTSSGNSFLVLYLIGFIAFFAFSQGAVVWVFISEIFPNSVRSQGGSLGSFTHWTMAAIISWVFPSIAQVVKNNIHIGVVYAFYGFAVMMLVHLIFVWKFLPETKGKSLEEIQKFLGIK
jgi:sugar porter (SP) family MFS transporter